MHNPEDYRQFKNKVISYLNKNKVDVNSITEYAVLVGIPLTVIYTFVIEEFPEKKEYCEQKIKELKDFYGY